MNRGDTGVAGPVRSAPILLLLIFSAFLSACTAVGPDYVRPKLPVPGSWGKTAGRVSTPAENRGTLARWWTAFDDPVLSDLMKRAVAGNLNLKEALSDVRQARIRRAITGADRFPAVSATGSAAKNYAVDPAGDFTSTDSYSLGLDASWELDIFGGVRRSLEASEAQLQASQDSYRDVLVSLLAEVGLNYVELRSYQARLAVAKSNLGTQEESLRIAQWRHQAGLTTELDVETARSAAAQTRATIPSLNASIEQARNRIAVLLGKDPGALDSELGTYRPLPAPPKRIAIGIPADLLRRRPDLRKAERDLAAQTAQIGVATAKRYPSFSLSGSIGLEALSASDLFNAGSRSAGLSSVISWPVFEAGAIVRNIALQYEIKDQKLIAYKAALLSALQDVENGLVAYTHERDRQAALLTALQSARKAAEMSRAQYASGLKDFETVLLAEQTQLNLQNQLTQSDAQVLLDLIELYKALGGGWNAPAAAG